MRVFDLVMSNPPYNKGMDHKILKEAIKYCNKLIIVMTERILVRHSRQKERDLLGKYLEKICLIKNSWAVFNIIHYSAEVVYVFNKLKEDKRININDEYFINEIDAYNKIGQLTDEEVDFIKGLRKIKKVDNNIFDNCSVKYPPSSFKVAYYITGGCNNQYYGIAQGKYIETGCLAKLFPAETRKSHTVLPNTKLKEPKEHEGRYFLTFETLQDVEDFKYSYRREVFEWYLGNFKF